MSSFITQCPHCETSFNITQAQLKLAKGKVRCGFCLQIFSALEQQLFFDEDDDQDLAQDLEIEDVSDSYPKTSLEDYYAYLELNNEKAKQNYIDNLAEIAHVVPPVENIEASSEEEIEPSEETIEESKDEFEEIEGVEESIDEIIDEPRNDEANSDSKGTLEPKLDNAEDEALLNKELNNTDSADSLESTSFVEDTEDIDEELETPSEEVNDEEEENPDELHEENFEDAHDEDVKEISEENIEDILEEQAEEAEEESKEEIDKTIEEELPPAQANNKDNKKKEELQRLETLYDDEALNSDGQNPVAALSDEPIPIYQQQNRSVIFTYALFFSNILLILGIAAQYTWANIDNYLRDSRITPLTGIICYLADCPVIERFDLRLFEFSDNELFVNNHPSIPDALQIDFIFRNTAEFEQVFPLVELNFTDLNRRLVANRLFKPEEYLEEELQQFTHLPPNSSIQIRLEISDPGTEAANYSLFLRAP